MQHLSRFIAGSAVATLLLSALPNAALARTIDDVGAAAATSAAVTDVYVPPSVQKCTLSRAQCRRQERLARVAQDKKDLEIAVNLMTALCKTVKRSEIRLCNKALVDLKSL